MADRSSAPDTQFFFPLPSPFSPIICHLLMGWQVSLFPSPSSLLPGPPFLCQYPSVPPPPPTVPPSHLNELIFFFFFPFRKFFYTTLFYPRYPLFLSWFLSLNVPKNILFIATFSLFLSCCPPTTCLTRPPRSSMTCSPFIFIPKPHHGSPLPALSSVFPSPLPPFMFEVSVLSPALSLSFLFSWSRISSSCRRPHHFFLCFLCPLELLSDTLFFWRFGALFPTSFAFFPLFAFEICEVFFRAVGHPLSRDLLPDRVSGLLLRPPLVVVVPFTLSLLFGSARPSSCRCGCCGAPFTPREHQTCAPSLAQRPHPAPGSPEYTPPIGTSLAVSLAAAFGTYGATTSSTVFVAEPFRLGLGFFMFLANGSDCQVGVRLLGFFFMNSVMTAPFHASEKLGRNRRAPFFFFPRCCGYPAPLMTPCRCDLVFLLLKWFPFSSPRFPCALVFFCVLQIPKI